MAPEGLRLEGLSTAVDGRVERSAALREHRPNTGRRRLAPARVRNVRAPVVHRAVVRSSPGDERLGRLASEPKRAADADHHELIPLARAVDQAEQTPRRAATSRTVRSRSCGPGSAGTPRTPGAPNGVSTYPLSAPSESAGSAAPVISGGGGAVPAEDRPWISAAARSGPKDSQLQVPLDG